MLSPLNLRALTNRPFPQPVTRQSEANRSAKLWHFIRSECVEAETRFPSRKPPAPAGYMRHFDQELVSGSILRSVWKLSWPVICLQLVSGIHGFVDHVLVGYFVQDFAANAAIGVAWQLFLVMVVFIASLFNGMGVLVARYAGRRDRVALSNIAYQVFLTSFYILIFVAAPLGYFFTPSLLRLTNAQPEVIAYAEPFLKIVFTCSAPLFMMFALNNAFQASGDPRTPLKLGILTAILNVILSSILITGMGPFPELGVMGAAIGTVLSPIPSVAISISLIMRHKMIVGPPEKFTLRPDFQIIRTVARIGIPTGIQAVLLNVGGAILLGFIGTVEHSIAAQAAYTICYTQLFSFVTWASFGLRASSATLMGQNLGAGQPDRARMSVYATMVMAMLWASLWAIIYWTFPSFLMSLFNQNEGDVFTIGRELLQFLAVSAFFVSAALTITGGLQGAGDTKTPMYIAFVSQIVVLLGLCFVFQQTGYLSPTSIWTAVLISHFTRFIATAFVFHQGRWAHIELNMGT